MRRLIIAPHVDDEVIGCSSLLDGDTLVYYVGVDDFHEVPADERYREAKAVAEDTGHMFHWPSRSPENIANKVNEYNVKALIDEFERAINTNEPAEVLLPWPSYNQDHQVVYDAAMVALRPHDRNHFVPRVLLYEEPDCWWPGMRTPFVPNTFVPVDIGRKLRLYGLMASQVRLHRAFDHLRSLAIVRGGTVMLPYAEAFHSLRQVRV